MQKPSKAAGKKPGKRAVRVRIREKEAVVADRTLFNVDDDLLSDFRASKKGDKEAAARVQERVGEIVKGAKVIDLSAEEAVAALAEMAGEAPPSAQPVSRQGRPVSAPTKVAMASDEQYRRGYEDIFGQNYDPWGKGKTQQSGKPKNK